MKLFTMKLKGKVQHSTRINYISPNKHFLYEQLCQITSI